MLAKIIIKVIGPHTRLLFLQHNSKDCLYSGYLLMQPCKSKHIGLADLRYGYKNVHSVVLTGRCNSVDQGTSGGSLHRCHGDRSTVTINCLKHRALAWNKVVSGKT